MRLKFISLNIWGGKFLDKIIEFLGKEKPDILTLQEVYFGTDKDLEQKLSFIHSSFAPAFKDTTNNMNIESGNAILSRFPIKHERVTFYDIPYKTFSLDRMDNYEYVPRNIQHAFIEANGIPIHVFNTQGIWGFDGKDNPRRLQMAQIIVNEIKNKQYTILTGDFNVSPDTKTVNKIEKYLKNIFKGELRTTFNMKRKRDKSFASTVVDIIFVSKNINVVKRYCPEVDISDHLPLVCVLEFN